MSNPTWPVYTFQLNLTAAQRMNSLLPSATQPLGNETTSEASNIPATFTSWVPQLLPGCNLAEIIGQPGTGKNGYQFTAYGQNATYLKNTYANGGPDDLLIIVS